MPKFQILLHSHLKNVWNDSLTHCAAVSCFACCAIFELYWCRTLVETGRKKLILLTSLIQIYRKEFFFVEGSTLIDFGRTFLRGELYCLSELQPSIKKKLRINQIHNFSGSRSRFELVLMILLPYLFLLFI